MTQFDDLVAKYRNLTYGKLASNNPSAIKSLLDTTDKSLSDPQYFGNVDSNKQQYIETPSGLIAQNKFTIDPLTGIPVFQIPLSERSATYDPNEDYGDPGYAGVVPEDEEGSNENEQASVNQLYRGGAGQERDMTGIQSGLERIGGMNLKINPVSGRIEVLDPNSLVSNLLTDYSAIQKFTPTGMLSGLLGGNSYGNQLDRIRSQYGDAIANEIAATVQESYRTGYAPSGLLAGGLKPGTKVKRGNTPGFINSQGNFQAGTPIGELDANKTKTKRNNDSKDGSGSNQSSQTSGTGIGGFTDADATRERARTGVGLGGDSDGSNKIVCTMMNESYGFGSFRNAIWLKYAKDNLSPEYQIGYHKLFLPLVKYAKGSNKSNLFVKNILEHIATHRTIDLKQQMRNNKRHTLGRIYRAILEPLCYIVGKYGK